MHFHVVGGSVPHALSHLAHDLQLLLAFLNVNQPDLLDGKLLIPLDEALHKLRSVAAPAADSHNLYGFLFHD
jgi:hypothetical protein